MATQIVLGIFFAFHLAILPTFSAINSDEVRSGSPADINDIRWQHSHPGMIPDRKHERRKKAKHYANAKLSSDTPYHLS